MRRKKGKEGEKTESFTWTHNLGYFFFYRPKPEDARQAPFRSSRAG
jgi:hypothetical protein